MSTNKQAQVIEIKLSDGQTITAVVPAFIWETGGRITIQSVKAYAPYDLPDGQEWGEIRTSNGGGDR